MPYNWQVFDRRATPLVKRPEVTIQKKGMLSMNASAHHALGRPDAVELLWDAEQRVIGLRPVATDSPQAYPLRSVGTGNSFVISGTAFFAFFGISPEAPKRRDVKVEDGVLILDLKDPGRDATSNRNRRKASNAGSEPAELPHFSSGTTGQGPRAMTG